MATNAHSPIYGVTGASKSPSKLTINVGKWEVPIVTNNAILMAKTIGGILLAITGGILWAVTKDPAVGTFLAGGGIGLLGGATVQTKTTAVSDSD